MEVAMQMDVLIVSVFCFFIALVIALVIDGTTRVVHILRNVLIELRLIRFQLGRPGLVKLKLEKERFDMATSVFDVTLVLPGASAPDVTKRVLQYSLGGASTVTLELGAGASEYALASVPQDTSIVGSLVDVDESGNQSQPSEFSLVVSDTQAPPQPGQVGLVLGGEKFVDDAPVAPVVDEAPAAGTDELAEE